MAVAVTVDSAVASDPSAGIDHMQSGLIVTGSLTLTGSYGAGSPVTDGDIISWASVSGHRDGARITSTLPPRWVLIYQEPTAGNAPIVYAFLYARGTTRDNGRLIVQDGTLASIATGAYPAALTSTSPSPNIRYIASFANEL